MAQSCAGEGDDEELNQELELVRAMWPSEEELEIQRSPRAHGATSAGSTAALLIAQLAPNTGGNAQSQHLRCELIITVPCGYPGDPVNPVLLQLRMGASSGLADARRDALLVALVDMLRGGLAGLPGAIPAILEAAQEQLTAWNDEGPVGQCPVCLAELDCGADSFGQTDNVRLPCFHTMHAVCFAHCWKAEWLRQRESSTLSMAENAAMDISEAVVACPECRQIASWADVPRIHPLLEHVVPVSTEKAVGPKSNHRDNEAAGEEIATVEEEDAATCIPSLQQPSSANSRIDLFEVIMPRGLRTRLKPKWDARDHEGPILRNGASGVVAEFVEGKDATYLRPEGMDYWLPLHGGRNNCKMVRIDYDMPRPQKAPSGWIHGDSSLSVDVVASTSPGIGKASFMEGKAAGKERKKKTKTSNSGGGYSVDRILGA
mmetsp:Transcript_421/g.616  ORF Transcript_421/g.616 Transcript_421/m.616 type:complete len:432 (-) Transcript_421:197-1492(-)